MKVDRTYKQWGKSMKDAADKNVWMKQFLDSLELMESRRNKKTIFLMPAAALSEKVALPEKRVNAWG